MAQVDVRELLAHQVTNASVAVRERHAQHRGRSGSAAKAQCWQQVLTAPTCARRPWPQYEHGASTEGGGAWSGQRSSFGAIRVAHVSQTGASHVALGGPVSQTVSPTG